MFFEPHIDCATAKSKQVDELLFGGVGGEQSKRPPPGGGTKKRGVRSAVLRPPTLTVASPCFGKVVVK